MNNHNWHKFNFAYRIKLASILPVLMFFLFSNTYALIQIDVTYSSSPCNVKLSWNSQGSGSQVQVYRRLLGDEGNSSWVLKATVSDPAISFTDNSISANITYEYQVIKVGDSQSKGYVVAGVNVPLVEDRGIILLVVDNTIISSLKSELYHYEENLRGDGWSVIRCNTLRHGSQTPAALKAWIKSQYDANPSKVKALLLFGHLPICMSGYSAPDGHDTRPLPTDLFYADMDGNWTDVATFNSNTSYLNLPGDGIFDQNYLPGNGKVEIQVGRVDLSGMAAFSSSEIELLRKYLNKDHNWRHGITKAQLKAIAGDSYLPVETSCAYSLFGSPNVVLDGFYVANSNTYTWGIDFGDATGSNYPSYNYKMSFVINFGSHKQKFERDNNPMRAILCLPDYGLTCAWGSRPNWFFHHMGMGQTIGYSAYRTQNNSYSNSEYTPACHYWFQNAIWNNLMGDPTLRMHIVTPPSSLSASKNSGSVVLAWTASPDATNGYHIYRSDSDNGTYARMTTSPVTATTYTDASPGATVKYMIRALKLEQAATGSYFNLSQGAIIYNPYTSVTDTLAPTAPSKLIASGYTATSFTLTWSKSLDNIGVSAYEIFKDGVSIGTTTSLSLNITGLTTNIYYALKVNAKDAAGNVSESSETLNVIIDTQAPTAPSSLVASSITSTGFTLSWSASTDNVGIYRYAVYKNSVFYSYSSTTSRNITGLSPATSYTMTVKAQDAAGNISDISTALIVTTPSTTDTEIPTTPTGLNATAITNTSFTLSWTASTDNVGVVSYEVFRGTTSCGTTASTSLNIIGLTAATTYSMTVKAKDAAGNVSAASTALSVTTLYNPDTQPPTAPTNQASSSITQTGFTLTWTASTDNVGVVSYEVFRGTTSCGTTASTSFNITGLTAATTYSMTVKAKDAAGNVSAASTVLSVTTLNNPDIQSPSAPTNLASSSITPTGFTLSWTASTDNVGVISYEVFRGTTSCGTKASTSLNITGLTAATTYSMTVKAKDAAGNVSAASTVLDVYKRQVLLL